MLLESEPNVIAPPRGRAGKSTEVWGRRRNGVGLAAVSLGKCKVLRLLNWLLEHLVFPPTVSY